MAQGAKQVSQQTRRKCITFSDLVSEVTLLPGCKSPHLLLERVSRSHGGGANGIREITATASENGDFTAARWQGRERTQPGLRSREAFPMETGHVFRQRRRSGGKIAGSGGAWLARGLAGLPWLREASLCKVTFQLCLRVRMRPPRGRARPTAAPLSPDLGRKEGPAPLPISPASPARPPGPRGSRLGL